MDDSKLFVTEEFEMLFQALSLEERTELERELLKDNTCQTLYVWQNILVEAPEKYEICMKQNIPYTTKELTFTDTLEAGAYICVSELKRKDLTVEMKTYLIGRLFLYRQEIAARDFVKRNPNVIIYKRRGNRPKAMSEIAEEIAAELNLATGTILKYGRYAYAIESIKRLDPVVAKAILSHRIRISHEDLQKLIVNENRLNIIRKLSQEIKKPKVIYYDFKKRMEEEIERQNQRTERRIIQRKVNPSIHEMPKYDPDADILNLIYTIPSWISSIERARNNTNFNNTTMKSNQKLASQIISLREILDRLEVCLKEVM